MASRKRKRLQFWAGHALILTTILCGVTAVNSSGARVGDWHSLTNDALRAAFLVIVVLAIAVSFSGKGPEERK